MDGPKAGSGGRYTRKGKGGPQSEEHRELLNSHTATESRHKNERNKICFSSRGALALSRRLKNGYREDKTNERNDIMTNEEQCMFCVYDVFALLDYVRKSERVRHGE